MHFLFLPPTSYHPAPIYMSKYLIINADDFGLCHAANQAIIELLEDKLISSATLMTPCAWFPEAAEYARTHPEKCIGVHLTFTSEWKSYRWGPVSRTQVSSLMVDGYFHPDEISVEKLAKPQEVETEIRAQIALARAYGIVPSHLDNHMGSLYGLSGIQTFLPLVFQICAEMGLPFRFPRSYLPGDEIAESVPVEVREGAKQVVALADALKVALPDYLVSLPYEKLPGETYESFRDFVCERLMNLPPGIHELFIHPAKDGPELRALISHWEKRTWEDRLLRDPQVLQAIKQSNISQIDWRGLARLRATL